MKFHSQKFRVRFSLRQVIRSYISMYASALLRFHLQIRRALLPARPRFVNTPDSAITACVLKPNGLMMRLCKHTKQSLPPAPCSPGNSWRDVEAASPRTMNGCSPSEKINQRIAHGPFAPFYTRVP